MTDYRIAATNSSRATRYGEPETDSEAAALDKARDMSSEFPGISFGVFKLTHGEGAFLVASFLNGERRFAPSTP